MAVATALAGPDRFRCIRNMRRDAEALREIVRPKPYPSIEGFKTIIKDASERIPAAKTANPKDFIDVSLLEELDKSGFIDALYR